MTAPELTRFQEECARHLSFSLTVACPLKCAHCMVATIPPREAAAGTLPVEVAERFAREMPELARRGVRRVSFTGGEPMLARVQLRLLSEAAARAGIAATVVTACHWAKTPRVAARRVAELPGVTDWHLSTDVYHRDQLDPAMVVNAATAAAEAGCSVMLRMAVSRVPTTGERDLIAEMRRTLPQGVPVALQPVVPVGRARDLGLAPGTVPGGAPPAAPCLTTGPLIGHDGQLLPCCSGLSEVPATSPFARFDAGRGGLAAAYSAWRADPLMKLVRVLGFAIPATWAEAALGRPPVSPAPEHPCDYCVALWAEPGARAAVAAQLARPEVWGRIAALDRAVFAKPATEEA